MFVGVIPLIFIVFLKKYIKKIFYYYFLKFIFNISILKKFKNNKKLFLYKKINDLSHIPGRTPKQDPVKVRFYLSCIIKIVFVFSFKKYF
jgi:hypothetical protein